MIILVTAPGHQYTHKSLAGERETVELRVVSWDELLTAKRLPRATYILTDFDRLPAWQLHDAFKTYRKLEDAGCLVLNNPARFITRYGLLRQLFNEGFNAFNAYRPEEGVTPARWPVFLRNDAGHHGPVSGLLEDNEGLVRMIENFEGWGYSRSTLVTIEYAGEPVRPGLFRKLSVFRVGERLLGYLCGHDDQWLVKVGKSGIAPLELYNEEFEFVRDDTFAKSVSRAFEVAGVEYGRVDFGLLSGRPQIFEINTNPYVAIRPTEPHPIPRRNETIALFRTKYLAALAEIAHHRP